MDWKIVTVQKAVHEGYPRSSLTLRSLGASLHASPNYLGRLFAREVGRHFHDYLLDVRLTRARELLSSTTLTSKEVAHEVGFKNSSTFYRAFRSASGITPKAYRIICHLKQFTNGAE